jgi:heme-degrading monooxygenase HmoA
MFARLGKYIFHIDKLDEAVKRYEDRVIPAMKSLKGYRGAYMLSDRRTGKGISMTLWDSEEDVITDEQSGLYQKQKDRYKDVFTAPTVREGYEVSAQD